MLTLHKVSVLRLHRVSVSTARMSLSTLPHSLTLTQCDSLCDSADDFCQNRWHDPRLFGAGDPRMMQRVVLVVVSVVMRMVVIVRRRSRH